MDRFKLERGVATSRRRGSRNTRPPLPLTSPTSQKRRTNGKVDGCTSKRDAGNYLLRWNGRWTEFRRSEVTVYVLT